MKWLKTLLTNYRKQSLWRMAQKTLRTYEKAGIPKDKIRRARFEAMDDIFGTKSAEYRISYHADCLCIVPVHHVYPGEDLAAAVAEYAAQHSDKQIEVEILHKRIGEIDPKSVTANPEHASYEIMFTYGIMHETPQEPWSPHPNPLYVTEGHSLENAKATAQAMISSHYMITYFHLLPKVPSNAFNEVE